jgi:hypothetical protein
MLPGVRRQPIERILIQISYARAHSYHPGPDERERISAADVTFGAARWSPCNILRVHTFVSRFGPWTICTDGTIRITVK